jgi:hypothetical protein
MTCFWLSSDKYAIELPEFFSILKPTVFLVSVKKKYVRIAPDNRHAKARNIIFFFHDAFPLIISIILVEEAFIIGLKLEIKLTKIIKIKLITTCFISIVTLN